MQTVAWVTAYLQVGADSMDQRFGYMALGGVFNAATRGKAPRGISSSRRPCPCPANCLWPRQVRLPGADVTWLYSRRSKRSVLALGSCLEALCESRES